MLRDERETVLWGLLSRQVSCGVARLGPGAGTHVQAYAKGAGAFANGCFQRPVRLRGGPRHRNNPIIKWNRFTQIFIVGLRPIGVATGKQGELP